MKIVSIVGARPQFVKEAALQTELNKYSAIKEVLVHTGQHYDSNMSDVFFDVLNMTMPTYNLGINSNLHGKMTGEMLESIEQVLLREMPDVVLLYGDTNSTIAGALAASKLKIKIAHVEAGLRQKKPKNMPEEINRVVTDHLSDDLFCPCQLAVDNLKREGIIGGVHFVGDVMYDVFLKMQPFFEHDLYKKYALKENEYIVMTLHRDFNVDEPIKLKRILEEMNNISKQVQVIYPVHPRTKKKIQEFGLEELTNKIIMTEPLDYLKLMGLTQHSLKVVTDSGGYQKEAYFAGKQAVVVMPETAWSELIDMKWNVLSSETELSEKVLKSPEYDLKPGVYGEGHAASKIVETLLMEN